MRSKHCVRARVTSFNHDGTKQFRSTLCVFPLSLSLFLPSRREADEEARGETEGNKGNAEKRQHEKHRERERDENTRTDEVSKRGGKGRRRRLGVYTRTHAETQ